MDISELIPKWADAVGSIIKGQIESTTIYIGALVLFIYVVRFLSELIIRKFFDEKKEINKCKNTIYVNRRFELFSNIFSELYDIEINFTLNFNNEDILDEEIKNLSLRYAGSNHLFINDNEFKLLKEIIDDLKRYRAETRYDFIEIKNKKDKLKKCLLG